MKFKFAVLFLFVASLSATAADMLRIKATKRLDNQRSSGNQQAFGGRTSLTQKEYYYRFDVQSVSPQVGNPINLEWAVMYEDWEGHIRPGTHGTCSTNVTMTKAVTVETDTVHLNQRNWQGPAGRTSKIEDKVLGYGLRVTDSNGNTIAEEYDPVSLKKEIDWKTIDAQPNQEALKALQQLIGGGQGGGQRPPPGQRPHHP